MPCFEIYAIEDEIAIAKEGYRFAQRCAHAPIRFVNRCPYGPADPGNGNWRAHAWCRGWWFYLYIAKRWQDLKRGDSEVAE